MIEVIMTPIAPPSPLQAHWRELYLAALFETDNNKVPARIAAAEKAIVARGRELFSSSSDTIDEDECLDDALYALRALQKCLQIRAKAA